MLMKKLIPVGLAVILVAIAFLILVAQALTMLRLKLWRRSGRFPTAQIFIFTLISITSSAAKMFWKKSTKLSGRTENQPQIC